jgi:hypothetical protein
LTKVFFKAAQYSNVLSELRENWFAGLKFVMWLCLVRCPPCFPKHGIGDEGSLRMTLLEELIEIPTSEP